MPRAKFKQTSRSINPADTSRVVLDAALIVVDAPASSEALRAAVPLVSPAPARASNFFL